jgi:hypothetical protein
MMTLFAVGMAACAADLAGDPTKQAQSDDLGSWKPEDPSATSADETATEALSGAPTDDAVDPHVSCSIVQFCNAPGADGTRCLQQGCSLTAAQDECTRESLQFCGTPVCPWIFVASDGTRFRNTTGVCR